MAACSPRCSALDRVGADDDFFDLGGNSLIATQAGRARSTPRSARASAVRALFEAPTVAALAARLEAAAPGAAAGRAGRRGTAPERIPLSLAQQRMWFVNQFDTDLAGVQHPVAVRLTGELDIDALRAAVGDVVDGTSRCARCSRTARRTATR